MDKPDSIRSEHREQLLKLLLAHRRLKKTGQNDALIILQINELRRELEL